jgi:hypothetical protein
MRAEVQDQIADMSPEERGQLIQRVKGYDWTEERKAEIIKFIMMLGIIGDAFPKGEKRRKPN